MPVKFTTMQMSQQSPQASEVYHHANESTKPLRKSWKNKSSSV